VTFSFGLEVPGCDLLELNALLDAKERDRAMQAAAEEMAKRMGSSSASSGGGGGDAKKGSNASRFPVSGMPGAFSSKPFGKGGGAPSSSSQIEPKALNIVKHKPLPRSLSSKYLHYSFQNQCVCYRLLGKPKLNTRIKQSAPFTNPSI
jgi:hypothetical protein